MATFPLLRFTQVGFAPIVLADGAGTATEITYNSKGWSPAIASIDSRKVGKRTTYADVVEEIEINVVSGGNPLGTISALNALFERARRWAMGDDTLAPVYLEYIPAGSTLPVTEYFYAIVLGPPANRPAITLPDDYSTSGQVKAVLKAGMRFVRTGRWLSIDRTGSANEWDRVSVAGTIGLVNETTYTAPSFQSRGCFQPASAATIPLTPLTPKYPGLFVVARPNRTIPLGGLSSILRWNASQLVATATGAWTKIPADSNSVGTEILRYTSEAFGSTTPGQTPNLGGFRTRTGLVAMYATMRQVGGTGNDAFACRIRGYGEGGVGISSASTLTFSSGPELKFLGLVSVPTGQTGNDRYGMQSIDLTLRGLPGNSAGVIVDTDQIYAVDVGDPLTSVGVMNNGNNNATQLNRCTMISADMFNYRSFRFGNIDPLTGDMSESIALEGANDLNCTDGEYDELLGHRMLTVLTQGTSWRASGTTPGNPHGLLYTIARREGRLVVI